MGQPELPPPYPQAPQQVPPQQQQPHEQPQTTDRGVPGGQRNKPQGKWERRFKNMGSKVSLRSRSCAWACDLVKRVVLFVVDRDQARSGVVASAIVDEQMDMEVASGQRAAGHTIAVCELLPAF